MGSGTPWAGGPGWYKQVEKAIESKSVKQHSSMASASVLEFLL